MEDKPELVKHLEFWLTLALIASIAWGAYCYMYGFPA